MLQMDILSYLQYLSASLAMLGVFAFLYIKLTPYDELALIRQGHGSACISLAGTLIGFALTLGACAIYHTSIVEFACWAVIAMVVQVLGYFVVIKFVGDVARHMERNNTAVGALIGTVGLLLGIVNAGCLS